MALDEFPNDTNEGERERRIGGERERGTEGGEREKETERGERE